MATKKNHNKDVYISDEGVYHSNKSKQTFVFVLLCRILSIVMAILGLAAFVSGNF